MQLPVASDFDKDGMLPEEAKRHHQGEARKKLHDFMMGFLFKKAVKDESEKMKDRLKKKKDSSEERKKLVFAFNK